MTITVNVPEPIATSVQHLPEGEARTRKVIELLWQDMNYRHLSATETAEIITYTDAHDKLLAEGIAASNAGRTRSVGDGLSGFQKRRDTERESVLGTL